MPKLSDAFAKAMAEKRQARRYDREAGVESYLAKRCVELGGEVRKVKWLGRKGAPDRLVLFNDGVLYWVETKTVGGRLSPSQTREHIRLRNTGQVVLVMWTKKQVDEFIDQLAPVLMAAAAMHRAIISITH